MDKASEQRSNQAEPISNNSRLAPALSPQTTIRHKLKEKTTMKKFITSTLLTAVAVPFLMAAPAAKKAQNTSQTSTASSTTTSSKKVKKHNKKNTSSTESSTTSTSTSQK
jgi:hypothetical protein